MIDGEKTDVIRVLYDDRAFRMKHGGVARYFCELFRCFSDKVKVRLSFNETPCYYLQQRPWSMPPPRWDYDAVIKRLFFGYRVPGVWTVFMYLTTHFPRLFRSTDNENLRRFIQLAKAGEYDLVHLTEAHDYGICWRAIPADKPVVVTIHDLIPELILKRLDVRTQRRAMLERATRIISVSEFTKRKLVEEYGVAGEKVSVIHHGFSLNDDQREIAEFKAVDHLLYVGKRNSYKQFAFFVKAIAPILRERIGLQLVCTGDAFSKNEKSLIESLGIRHNVHSRFVSDSELRWLYAHAKAFVYPSLMEGFGLPILEAFKSGCPVVLTNASCFPEVAGDAALYFCPDDAEGLKKQVMQLLDDEELSARLVEAGHRRLSLYSWNKCSAETESVYRAAIAENA